jgi:hypothetical protein
MKVGIQTRGNFSEGLHMNAQEQHENGKSGAQKFESRTEIEYEVRKGGEGPWSACRKTD